MKKVLALITFIMLATLAFAAGEGRYVVSGTDTEMLARELPVSTAKVLGSVNEGDSVTVVSLRDGWAQIDMRGRKAYIPIEYIGLEYTDTIPDPGLFSQVNKHGATIIVILQYIFLVVGIAFMMAGRRAKYLWGNKVVGSLFTLLCVVEILMGVFYLQGHEIPLFEWAAKMPWVIRALIALLVLSLFGMTLLAQFATFNRYMAEIQYRTSGFDYRIGLYGWLAGLAGILAANAWWPDIAPFAIAVYCIAIVVQTVIIFVKTSPRFGYGALGSLLVIVVPLGITGFLVPILPGAFKIALILVAVFLLVKDWKGIRPKGELIGQTKTQHMPQHKRK